MTNRIWCRLNVARQVTLGIAAIAAFAVPVAVGAIQQAPRTAIRTQQGIVDVLVVDRVERPTED